MPLILANVVQQQYREFELAGMPGGWLRLVGLLCVVGMGYAVVWLYRREARAGASLRLRMGLAAVRCAVLALLVVVWLDPVVATYTVRTIGARVLVLTDVSESMNIADAGSQAATPQTRIAAVRDLLAPDDYAWLRKLDERNELAWYSFGAQARRLALPAPADADRAATTQPATQPAAVLAATELATDLGTALNRAVREAGESPIAAVVVISDGALNRGLGPEALAGIVRRASAPLYAVGVGSPVDPPNVRVADFRVPATAAKGDPVELKVDLAATRIPATPLRVELLAQRLGDDTDQATDAEPQVVDTREIDLGGDQADASATFEVNADEAGQTVFTVRVAAVDGEPVVADNVRTAVMRVLDEQLRVLIVSGRPSFDYRYVTRLLERDQSINVSCWLQSADARAVRDGDTIITELPRTTEALFDYDVILLMDPEPSELDSAWSIAVHRLVDELGGGLGLIAGTHFSSRLLRDPRLEDLITLLPVVPDPDAEVRLSALGAYRTREVKFIVPDDALDHPLARLHADPQTNRAVWAALPGVRWYLPVLREKPLATVLMRLAGPSQTQRDAPVLLAAQPFGSGRTAFLAFDSTWRWRATAERYFEKFWINMVRYLGQSRREGANKRGTIVLDRDAVQMGEYVKVEVRVLGPDYAPWHAAELTAELRGATAQRRLKLEAIPGRAGWFGGRFSADWSGPTTLRVPLPDAEPGDPLGALVKRFHIFRPQVEMRTLRAHPETLRRLVEQAGGQYLEIAAAGLLPEHIPDATRQTPPRRNVDHRLWDSGWLLTVVAMLLGFEWTLRRRNHLL